MKSRICESLLILTLTWSTPAQTPKPSATYGNSLKLLTTWLDSEKNADLAPLFAMGDARASDFRAACRAADDKIASAAFYVLQLLGKSECVDCGNSISRKHRGLAFVCEANFNDVDFKRIEEWLDKTRAQKGYQCSGDSESFEPLNDSLVYALILEGSPRSESILNRLLAMDKACAWDNIISEPLEQAQSLIGAAQKVGHKMRLSQTLWRMWFELQRSFCLSNIARRAESR